MPYNNRMQPDASKAGAADARRYLKGDSHVDKIL